LTSEYFVTERADGRSDRKVIMDLVAIKEPLDILAYDYLVELLQEGLVTRTITRQTVMQTVRAANPVMLEEHQRCLRVIRGVGYQVAPASEHRSLALERRRRADRQLEMAVHTLQNVRWNEMEPSAREAHQALLTVVGAMWQAMEAIKSRQDKMDKILSQIVGVTPGA
jgi:hypothetical protein